VVAFPFSCCHVGWIASAEHQDLTKVLVCAVVFFVPESDYKQNQLLSVMTTVVALKRSVFNWNGTFEPEVSLTHSL